MHESDRLPSMLVQLARRLTGLHVIATASREDGSRLAVFLEDLLERKPKALSGGQRQRVAIVPMRSLSCSARLELIEHLGSETLAYVLLSEAASFTTVAIAGKARYEKGTDSWLAFDLERLLLFDRYEKRLKPSIRLRRVLDIAVEPRCPILYPFMEPSASARAATVGFARIDLAVASSLLTSAVDKPVS